MSEDREITVYGDGSQSRDFTYVSDVVEANLLAAKSKVEGETFNIGSGKRITVNRLIKLLEKAIGKKARIRFLPPQKGDVCTTLACIEKAKKDLGYMPKVSFDEGLRLFLEWFHAHARHP